MQYISEGFKMMNLEMWSPAEAEYFDAKGSVCKTQLSFSRTGDVIHCADDAAGIDFDIIIDTDKNGITACVPRNSLRETKSRKIKTITLFPGFIGGQDGDGGALILPLDSGRLCHTQNKKTGEYWFGHFSEPAKWEVSWSNMSVIGQYANGTARAAIIEGGKFDAQLRIRTCWGQEKRYTIDAVFFIRDFADEKAMDEDLTVIYGEMQGDYRAVAKYYREYALQTRKLPKLEEKSKGNPNLDYSARAMTVRCRMAVKPLPCKIPEQTPETEPPVKVFMKFADIRKIADEFARQKVGAAEFCLVGWGHGGHDGAFPQLFPPEEALGGEDELKKTIDYVKSLGYHISLHDNYYDGYTVANNFSLADAVVTHDGMLSHTSCGVLAGGQPYRVCGQMAAGKYAPANLPRSAALGINGAYFVDVISIIGMVKCYSASHPLSRGGNAMHYKRIMRMQQEFFNVSMSEGARDWAMPELDRTYMVLNCIDVPYECVDELIPFYQLVYHGIIIYNNFREGVNAFPGEKLYLMNVALGGLPLIYFHHIFHPDWNAASGWAKDLTLETPEKLTRDVAQIKRMSDDVVKLEKLRYIAISDFIQHSETLSQTIYENGTSVWVNYSEKTVETPAGDKIMPQDFLVIG